MPIFNPPYFEIDKSETKRYAGLKKSEFKEEIINEACELARLIINPTGIWNMYDYDNKAQTIETEPKFSLQGSSIEKHLKECEKVILLAATLGIEVEEKITSLFEEGKYGLSIILDAAATAAIEQSADLMEKAIGDQVNRMGYKMKWRFSPGYGDWPIQQQPEMIKHSHGDAIGIHLTESMMLEPRKSITAVIGLYKLKDNCQNNNNAEMTHNCESCNRLDCSARR